MKLAIMIPTYNRCKELEKNINMICGYIRKLKKENDFYIIVSNNASTDDTNNVIDRLINSNRDIRIDYNINNINIGLGRNFVKVFEISDSDYCMLLGDDDYISFEYLEKVGDIISNNKNIFSIVPSYYNIDINGRRMDRERDINKKSKIYKQGFWNCLINSWRAHQMSGLVFKKENLYDECKYKNIFNSYVQIYIFTVCCLNGDTYHLTNYPVKVTRPSQNKKAWSYGDDGLVSEVFENYKKIDNLKNWQRTLLEIRFLQKQYWRVAMYLKVGLLDFFKCILKIQKSDNTTKFTAVFLPLIMIFIFAENFLSLLLQGKVLSTLKTKVDIK